MINYEVKNKCHLYKKGIGYKGQRRKGDLFEYVLFYRFDLKLHTYLIQL